MEREHESEAARMASGEATAPRKPWRTPELSAFPIGGSTHGGLPRSVVEADNVYRPS